MKLDKEDIIDVLKEKIEDIKQDCRWVPAERMDEQSEKIILLQKIVDALIY